MHWVLSRVVSISWVLPKTRFRSTTSRKTARIARRSREPRNRLVAIPEADQTLPLTYARSYFGWDKSLSRFLSEVTLVARTSSVGVKR